MHPLVSHRIMFCLKVVNMRIGKWHDCEHEWKCVLANRTMHDTGYPQCVRLKSEEDDDFAMMLSHEFPDSRIERNVLNAMCAC